MVGPPSMYESWPQNFGYPTLMQCPNCHHHAQYPPAFCNFKPPCTHFPSAPPAYGHFSGGYPPHPHPHPQPSYPVSYVPPPHYTLELPKYEFDKNALHCCGCSKHSCHVKEGKNVRIEEHEPQVQTKKSEALIPAGTNNITHPILWIQPGYTMNKEQKPIRLVDNEAEKQHVSSFVRKPRWQQRSIETEAEEHQESPRAKKILWQRMPSESEAMEQPQQSMKIVEQDPNAQHGWFPLDMSNIRELLEGGQGRKNHELVERKGGDMKKKDEEGKQFPFPIIWMPYAGQGENHAKGQEENNVVEAPGKEASPTSKFIPMKLEHPDNEPVKTKTEVGDDGSGFGIRATEKTSNLKTIPVKQLEESVPTPLKTVERKEEGTLVKKAQGNGNAQSSSPTKKSKLPPICLRVDPPKKKNCNGSSRSPNPPADKKLMHFEEAKHGGSSKKDIKVAEAVDTTPSQSKIEVTCNAGEEMKEKHETDVEKKGVEGQEPYEAKKHVKKIMSDKEAATIIQSAYRGYAVRRWEPLIKLREIAKVREDAAEVKRHIEDIESRAGSSIDEKEKTIVAETIMTLLIKLDTIQGLHPSFRDVRRSVAKELTMLQEKLDSMIIEKSAPMAQERSTAEAKVSESTEAQETSAAEEPLQDSGLGELSSQLEGSIIKEPSNVSGLDESCRDIGQTSEESSKELNQVVISEEEVVPMLNEFSSVEPFTSMDVAVGVPENEETCLVKMDSVDKNPSNSTVDSQMNTKEREKVAAESHDQPTGIDTVENTTNQVDDVSSSQNDEPVNLPSELPREVVEEDKNEISNVDFGDFVHESTETASNDVPICEVLEVESRPAEKDEGLTLQTELPQEVVEPGNSKFPTVEAEKVQQSEPMGIDIPILEQSEHAPEELVAASEVPGALLKKKEDEQNEQSHEVDGTELDSTMASKENQVSRNEDEDTHELGGRDQERSLEKEESNIEAKQAEDENEESESKVKQEEAQKIIEENEKLREMVERMIASGKQQQDLILSLSGKVKDLEKKLGRDKKKKKKMKSSRVIVSRASCRGKPSNGALGECNTS